MTITTLSAPRAPEASRVDRRGFIGRVAAALALGGAANVGAIVTARAAEPAPHAIIAARFEDPELLALGEELGAVEDRFGAAVAARAAAYARLATIAPPVPDELRWREFDYRAVRQCTEPVRDYEGDYVSIEGPKGTRPLDRVISSRKLIHAMEELDGRTRIARELRRRLKIARGYERAHGRAVRVAGVPRAWEDWHDARIDMWRIAEKVLKVERARTHEGLLIRARMARLVVADSWASVSKRPFAGLSEGLPMHAWTALLAGDVLGLASA